MKTPARIAELDRRQREIGQRGKPVLSAVEELEKKLSEKSEEGKEAREGQKEEKEKSKSE